MNVFITIYFFCISATPIQASHSTDIFSVFPSQLNREASDTEDRTAIRTYSGSKMASRSYHRVRQQFAVALRDGGLGVWTRKPTDLDQFTVTV